MDYDSLELEGSFSFAILVVYLLSSMYFPVLKFNPNFFFYFVLPPIIFTEGYTMRRKRFFKNISYISLFGVLGTFVTFVVNTLGAYYISQNDLIIDKHGNAIPLTDQDVFLIGAILSASDAVASCSMIEKEDSPQIHSILLGSGVMNEAVVLTLFNSSSKSIQFQASAIAIIFAKFIYTLLGSIAIGLSFGVLSALMTKYVKKFEDYPSYETALLFFLAYIGFFLTEMLECPGVISILCSGIVMGHYTWYNLSVEARIVSRAAFTIMGELLTAFIFVYVGFSTYPYITDTISFTFIGLMILVLMFGRFLGIIVIPGISKLVLKRRFILNWKDLGIVWITGCIRGAIAFALILSVNSSSELMLLKTTILGVVLSTTIVFGAMMPFLKKLTLSLRTFHAGLQEPLIPIPFDLGAENNDPASFQGSTPRHSVHLRWRNFDDRYLKPLLLRSTGIIRRTTDTRDPQKEAGTQTDPEFETLVSSRGVLE